MTFIVPDQTLENGVFAAVYDPVNHQLNTTDVSPGSGNEGNDAENGAIAGAYDPTTQTLRVVVV